MAKSPARETVPCILIPAFNEAHRIGPVVSGALAHGYPVVVIDDGSSDDTGALVRSLGAEVIRHEDNHGKGASLVSGFTYAREHGHPVVVTLDADGQHDPAEISRFVDTYRRTGIPVLIGNRMWNDAEMPIVRRWTNRVMSRLLCRIMKTFVPDTQCGFRLYRTDVLSFAPAVSRRFAMESEVLLHLALRGFRMDSVRVSTIYRGSKSRINPLVDTLRFFMMLLQFHHDRQMRRTKAG
mgnify:CR=1 FL=1